MPFNDVEEGFIPSLMDRFYCAEIFKRLFNGFPGGDKPHPYVNLMSSIIFNCTLIGLNLKPSYETMPKWHGF